MSFGIPVRNGLGVGLLASTSLSTRGGSFSPASLFLAGEQGFIYDPSDFSTLYQDPAGTTPVTAVGQTVGLVLDRSKGLVLGPQLRTSTATASGGWTESGGIVTATGSGGADNVTFTLSTPTVAGRFYEVLIPNTMPLSGFYADFGGGTGSQVGNLSSANQRVILTCTAPGTVLRVGRWVGAPVGTIGPISVRELPGNHATQSVLASRPILAREPLGGRRNLLTYTEQFDNGVWSKTGSTISPDNTTAPDNTLTADKLVENTSTGVHRVNPATAPTIVSGLAYTATVYAKAAERTQIRLIENATTGAFASFDILNGTVLSTGSGGSGEITSVGNGWYRCELRFTSAGTFGRIDITLSNSGSITYTGVAGSGAFIWGAQLELGSTATAYQRVTSVYDVTEAGKADLHYLLFDGSDDFLVTPTITPGTDKAQVFAGLRKLSDAGVGVVIESSANAVVNNGTFTLRAPRSAAANYVFASRGTALAEAIPPSNYAAPITNVVSAISDISGDGAVLRVNNTQAASSATDQGTGNYLAYPVYIGRLGGVSAPFNGRLYGLIARFGPNLSDVQIAQTEQWLNQKTGAY